MKRRVPVLLLLLGIGAAVIYYVALRPRAELVISGIVTTDDIAVGAQIQGRIQQLLVTQGQAVKSNQLLAVLEPQEWRAGAVYYAYTERQSAAQVGQAEAEWKYQEGQVSNQISQAEANVAAAEAQVKQAQADREIARLNFERVEGLYKTGVEAVQSFDQARTSYEAAKARVDSLEKQVMAAQAAVGLARSAGEQVAARRAALEASRHQVAAAAAQKDRADIQLAYTELRAPIDGLVNVRAALAGEIVNPGQPIVTLVNPDDLWVRADVEEGLIDRIHVGDKLQVRLPSGARREGTVFFRGIDADYATQRDVSRSKRDIKTFEIRLRCDNADRSLALGMSAYVILPAVR
jgi:HlyD family secretion protein